MNKLLTTLMRSAVMGLALSAITLAPSSGFTKAQTPAPSQVQSAKSLTAKERIEVFEEVWGIINEKYYDPSFNGVDWNAARGRFRPRVDAVASDEEFYRLLNQMTGELRDAHTRVRSPRQNQDRKNQQATSAGVLVYEVEGTPAIFDVTPDSDAARAGIVPGMIVRTVNGQPIAAAIAAAREEVGASSTERASRILSYSRLIAGEPGTPLKLGLTRADDTTVEVTLMRRTISAAPQFTARLLASGYAYIRFNRFRPPVAKQIKEALQQFKDAPGLILDLRTNSGGDGGEGMKVAGYFFNEKVPMATIVTRTGKSPSALFGLVSLPKVFEAGEKGKQLYSNPVVILINEATGSTSELVASGMQEKGRAQIVGTQSCGCVLGVLKHRDLKGGGELAISEVAFVTPQGRKLEGNGVMPDRKVSLTLTDLQRQRDTALEEAEKYLNSSLKGKLIASTVRGSSPTVR
jgi:carboxyl-terminal processing protease